jgi:ribosomal-protein-alanine N-acetyltransferase
MILATLEVRASNEAAIGLYESLGFVVKGRRRGYYEREGEDALLMEAPLSKDEGSIRCTEER